MTRFRVLNLVGIGAAVLLVGGSMAAYSLDGRNVVHRVAPASAPPAPTVPPPTAPATTPTTAAPTTTTTTTIPRATVPPSTAPAPDPNRRWAVGVTTMTFVDTSRPTPAAGSDPGEAYRSLPTTVRYPVAGAAGALEAPGAVPSHRGGPFPLIVFGPGYDSSPAVYASLLHAWAGAGYVVAAPAFPRATAGGPLDENDLNAEPGDLSFVISQMLSAAVLRGVIDSGRIGVAGHSDGGDAAIGAGYDTCCIDHRIRAVAVAGVDQHAFPGGSWFPAGSPPLLVAQADHDVFNPPADGRQVFADAHSPKFLLWLINATHLESVTTDTAHLAVFEGATIGFFDQFLKGRSDGLARLRQAVTPSLATLAAG